VIVLAIEPQDEGGTVVVVLPITHRPPEDTSAVITGRQVHPARQDARRPWSVTLRRR
jgi:hypothetical protein